MCLLPPELPSFLPPQPIPPGCHRPLAVGALLHASNWHRLSVLHMVMYVLQCRSLRSSHPLLFPQSPKVCSESLDNAFCWAAAILPSSIFSTSTRTAPQQPPWGLPPFLLLGVLIDDSLPLPGRPALHTAA